MRPAHQAPEPHRTDMHLVGRVAALAVAHEAARRSQERRDGHPVPPQPLRDVLTSVIADQTVRTIDERADTLDGLRAEIAGSADRADHRTRRTVRYGRP